MKTYVSLASIVAALLLLGETRGRVSTAAAVGAGAEDCCATTSRSAGEAEGAVHREHLRLPRTAARCRCAAPAGRVGIPCKDALFCAAFRAPWAEALAKERMYIANIFSRDLYLWDSFPDHNDLVRGYILEKYFTDDQSEAQAEPAARPSAVCRAPSTRLRRRRASSSATSALPSSTTTATSSSPTSCRSASSCAPTWVRSTKVRALSVRIQQADPKFKPLRDAVHNQLSPGLVPQLVAFRDPLPPGPTRTQVDELIAEIAS